MIWVNLKFSQVTDIIFKLLVYLRNHFLIFCHEMWVILWWVWFFSVSFSWLWSQVWWCFVSDKLTLDACVNCAIPHHYCLKSSRMAGYRCLLIWNIPKERRWLNTFSSLKFPCDTLEIIFLFLRDLLIPIVHILRICVKLHWLVGNYSSRPHCWTENYFGVAKWGVLFPFMLEWLWWQIGS